MKVSLSVLLWGDSEVCSTWFLEGSPGLSVPTLITSSLMHKLLAFSLSYLMFPLPQFSSQRYQPDKLLILKSLSQDFSVEESKLRHWFRGSYLDHLQPLNIPLRGGTLKEFCLDSSRGKRAKM